MKDCFDMSPACLTGGYPNPLREFPIMNMGVPSPRMNWQYSQMYQRKTPSPPERRDSGVNVSSPSSDESERYATPTMLHSPQARYAYANAYQNPNIMDTSRYSSPNHPVKVEEEPNAPEDERQENSGSPANTNFSNDTNALKSLQASVEKNLNISRSSPEPDDRTSDNNNEYYSNMEEYGIPSVNSHGKVKTVKCKQCQVVFKTKLEFWMHQRTHIKPDKLLQCKMCPFVTEYKHHLEYHLRNHDGKKPFQCQECDYKCVNKSMLNSHMKSHSNVYQYRCASCHYSSKYCHSLKLHLRKYNHQPAMVLNPDGTPNPLPIIDVYGTRRGPKLKTSNGEEEIRVQSPKRTKTEGAMPNLPALSNLPGVIQGVHGMMPLPLMPQDPSMQFNLMMQQAFLMQTLQNMQMFQNQNSVLVNSPSSTPDESTKLSQGNSQNGADDSALDLSKDKTASSDESEKGTLKLDTPSTTDDEDFETMNLLYNVKVEHDVDDTPSEPSEKVPSTPSAGPSSPQPTLTEESLRCPHCCITFDDIALFTIHMRFHNFSDPFTCNSCGQKCENKIEFTVHIFSRPH